MPLPLVSSLPRNSLILEVLLDGNVLDTNDGTKATLTATSLSYTTCPAGYQKQCGSFSASSSLTRASLSGILGVKFFIYPTSSTQTIFTYITGSANITINSSSQIATTGLTNVSIRVNGISTTQLTLNTWQFVEIDHDSATATNWNLGSSSFTGYIAGFRQFSQQLSEPERQAYWLEFNRQLAGGTDFGAVIPQPTDYLEAIGEDTFYDVALGTKATRTAGTVATDDFGISRAIAAPNQSWTSVSGDSFVYWNNSGWKLEKNNAAVSATGINTANTVRCILYFPAGTISTAQQTFLENALKVKYSYPFRKSLPIGLQQSSVLYSPGIIATSVDYDLSTYANHGIANGSSTLARILQNQVVGLNGSSQYSTFPSASQINFGSGDFTVCGWVKFTALSGSQKLFSKMNSQSLDGIATGWNFGIDDVGGGNYSWNFTTWESNSNTNCSGAGGNFYGAQAGKWHFVTCQRSGNELRIFLDCVKILSNTGTIRNVSSIRPFDIGRYNWSNSQYVNGARSDAFAFGRAISVEEMRSLMYSTFRF